MKNPIKMYKESDTTRFFEKMSLLWYLTFLPNFWKPRSELNLSPLFIKIYDVCIKCVHGMLFALVVISFGALWTQKELTQHQKCSRNLCVCGSPFALLYGVYLYYRTDINELLYNIAVVLKQEYNDEEIEKAMIFKIKWYIGSIVLLTLTHNVFLGMYGAYELLYQDGGFVTYISVWPDVTDHSTTALVARVVLFFAWLVVLWQTIGTTSMILTILTSLAHQFKNLGSYFYTIDDIFYDTRLTQTEKEAQFEKAFIKGIRWHVLTLQCVQVCQHTCRMVFNVQMVITPGTMIAIMPDLLKSSNDWNNAISQFPVLAVLLLFLGLYMWNAGDITVEASKLPGAMYACGWQHCRGGACARARKLLIIAMTQALQPVELKAFGFFVLSYETYVPIVKTTYSVFTVFY